MKICSLQFGIWISTSEVTVIKTSYFGGEPWGFSTPSGEQPKNTLPFFSFFFIFESLKILMGWENCFLPSCHGEWLANDSNTQNANSWIQSLHLVNPWNVIVDAPGTLRTSKESSCRLQDRHLGLTEFWDYWGTWHTTHAVDELINHTVINTNV